jgi:hypothetical protein
MRSVRVALLAAAVAALAGCTSPEATRTRGGGPGADVGNRPQDVKLHEGSEPFWKTPDRIVGAPPPLESAQQARDDSLGKPLAPSTGSAQGR